VLGALSAMLLGSLRVTLPMLVSGALFLALSVALALVMPETQFHPVKPKARHTWKAMVTTFRGGLAAVANRPILKTILWIGVLFGFYSEAFDRLWVAHLMNDIGFPADLSPVAWIGAINISGMLFTTAALGILRRRVDTRRGRAIAGVMLPLTAMLVGCLAAFALAPGLWWSIPILWLIRMTREMNGTLYTTWVNQRLEAKVRATVLSMSSQVDAIGQIAGGPLLGALASAVTIKIALLASSLTLSPALGLIGWGLKQEKKIEERQR
jgi:DHA3 family tetracycline resistance protein-like MFS transporter